MSALSIYEKTLIFRNIHDEYNLDLSPSIIGYEMCAKNKPQINSHKPLYLIHFVIHGQGTISFKKNQKIHLSAGDCFLIEPNVSAIYQQDIKNPWSYFWLEINGELIKKICDKLGFKTNNYVLRIENMDQIIQCFEDMFNEDYYCLHPNAETLRVESIIYRIFSIITSQYNVVSENKTSSKKEIQIKKIIEYINNNFTSSDISIKKIAEAFFFNQAYLTRIFKESTGISPMKYIIVLRMRRAIELLEKRSFSISQIAYALGYKNQFYFSKEFKRFFGIQPSKYISSQK